MQHQCCCRVGHNAGKAHSKERNNCQRKKRYFHFIHTVTPSIGKEIIAETSTIGYFPDKNYKQMALSNLKEEVLL